MRIVVNSNQDREYHFSGRTSPVEAGAVGYHYGHNRT